jgi:3-oxosteroid 1-dehydrogenase
VRLSSEVKGLEVEAGRVVGVRVADGTGERLITARKCVLLDAGGFSHNLAMCRQYQPNPASVNWTMSNPGDTGDVMQMAMALGADLDCMKEAWWTPGSLLPDGRYAGFQVPGESAASRISSSSARMAAALAAKPEPIWSLASACMRAAWFRPGPSSKAVH